MCDTGGCWLCGPKAKERESGRLYGSQESSTPKVHPGPSAREQGSGEILIRGVGLRGGNIKQPISKGKGRNTRQGRTNEDCTGKGRSLGGKPWSELRVIDTEFSRKKGGWSGLQTGVSGQHHED